ncbi:replication-associated recombination protein A [Candidatus Marinimicrobia bacterium MT.SAG.4]|nr:replication-associated recombination protein A [Candidatus Marinimicrobia bacterium MT.SAG.4]
MNLFKEKDQKNIQTLPPLAERLRPTKLEEFYGHEKYLGKGKLLRRLIDKNEIVSLIFWGPPGSGKTTLAKIIARSANAKQYQISAVDSGVKELREIIKLAEANKYNGVSTLLFIDEIHRFNKAQQDALLGCVEQGVLTLIGATTENPSFEVISPLLSRTKVIKLEPLTEDDIRSILSNAIKNDEYLKPLNLQIDSDAEQTLIRSSGGDARRLLNTLEISSRLVGQDSYVTNDIVGQALLSNHFVYDKKGDAHYDTISAFIKSIRGSDPDAAVYWLARMLESGEDPKFIARRMIILASEDIGNADPFALVLADSTFAAIDKLGMPEARIVLSQAATYLASTHKSNASYLAIDKAIDTVKKGGSYPVPLHLRNAPTRLMKDEGYSDGYLYPHDYAGHFTDQNYLPPELNDTRFYEPTTEGREKKFFERLSGLWKKHKGIDPDE